MNSTETKQAQLAQLNDQIRQQVKIRGRISEAQRELDQLRSRLARMDIDLEAVVTGTKAIMDAMEGGHNNHFIVDDKLFTLTMDGGIYETPATTIPIDRGIAGPQPSQH